MLKKFSAPLCVLMLAAGVGFTNLSTAAAVPVALPPPAAGLQMVDENATRETASLFNFLRKTSGKGILFGHQHETTQGATVTDPASTIQSDTKALVGDYAAVYGWDTLSIIGDKSEGDITAHVKAAYRRGGIITISGHLPNPKTGGDAWDTTVAANDALPGGEKNAVFNSYLDDVAAFALSMKDDSGKPIPMMFRIMHENTGNWFWWGNSQTTPAQYIALYRYVVEYLRDKRGVHNFLYIYSPTDNLSSITEQAYLERYPGDAYVDVLGFDSYGPAVNNAAYIQSVVKYSALVSKMAVARGKVSVIAEVGMSADDIRAGKFDNAWYSKLLAALKADPDAKKIAYVLVWRNGYAQHFWVPTAAWSAPAALDDFKAFYNDPYTLFNDDLKNNVYKVGIPANDQATFAYLVTPTDLASVAITDSAVKLRARLVDAVTPSAVKVRLTSPANPSFAPIDYNLTLGASGYYEADLGASRLQEDNFYKLDLSVVSTDKIPTTSSSILVPSTAPVNPLIVEDFEGYLGMNQLLVNKFAAAGGDGASFSLDRTAAHSGNYAGKLTYNLGANGYAGVVKSLPDLNWSAQNTLRLWVNPDGKSQILVIQANVNGVTYEAYRLMGAAPALKTALLNANASADAVVPQVTSAGWVDVPFGEFLKAPWETQSGKFNPKKVSRFALYVDAWPAGTQVVGSTLLFDDIYATHVDGNGDFSKVDVPTNTGSTLFDFETDNEGWLGQINWSTDVPTTNSADWAAHGTKSVVSTIDTTTADSYAMQVFKQITTTGASKIKLHVKAVNAGNAVKAKMFVKDSSWAWSDSGEVPVPATGAELSIDVSALPSLNAVGVQFSGYDRTQTAAKFYIDYVVIETAATTTPSSSLFDFESDLGGWHGQVNWSGSLPATLSTDWANTGKQSALNTVDLTTATSYAFQVFKDVTTNGAKTVKLTVKTVNAGTGLQAKLFVKDGSWSWSDGGLVTLNADSTTLSIDVSALPALKSIGVEFVGFDKTQTAAQFYIDSVVIE